MAPRRPAVLAITIGLGITAAAGVLGVLHAMTPDREALREQLGRAIELVDAMPADDPVRKDRRIEELLAREDYQAHARTLWLKLDRRHGPAHQAARADEAARKALAPFLPRCSGLDGKPPGELRLLDEEARSLQSDFGSTRFGSSLIDVRIRIAAALAAASPPCTDLEHFRLVQEIEKDRIAGRFASALLRILETTSAHRACGDLAVKLREERAAVLRSATPAAENLLRKAGTNRAEGRKEEAARALDLALPNFLGLPEEGRLRALREELRRP